MFYLCLSIIYLFIYLQNIEILSVSVYYSFQFHIQFLKTLFIPALLFIFYLLIH